MKPVNFGDCPKLVYPLRRTSTQLFVPPPSMTVEAAPFTERTSSAMLFVIDTREYVPSATWITGIA